MRKVIICLLFTLLFVGCSACEWYPAHRQCFLESNTAFGPVDHRVSCNKEYTYFRYVNLSKGGTGCFDVNSEKFYDEGDE